ncbi:hypothetical protein [Dactylococcopsis salina]|uniref:hypothetical protein n=1 Tax=Dactylococcopsis salina TaxID=292566 RepID=UPI0002F90E64|nr:hypothetical protein [Dactylococcopsis salina]
MFSFCRVGKGIICQEANHLKLLRAIAPPPHPIALLSVRELNQTAMPLARSPTYAPPPTRSRSYQPEN